MKTKGEEVKKINEVKDFKEFREGTFKMGRCDVIVTIDNGLWHLSISCRKNQPSYKEIKEARYRYVPDDVIMAQIFPPMREFVNVHPFCHHLWEIGIGKEKEVRAVGPAKRRVRKSKEDKEVKEVKNRKLKKVNYFEI